MDVFLAAWVILASRICVSGGMGVAALRRVTPSESYHHRLALGARTPMLFEALVAARLAKDAVKYIGFSSVTLSTWPVTLSTWPAVYREDLVEIAVARKGPGFEWRKYWDVLMTPIEPNFDALVRTVKEYNVDGAPIVTHAYLHGLWVKAEARVKHIARLLPALDALPAKLQPQETGLGHVRWARGSITIPRNASYFDAYYSSENHGVATDAPAASLATTDAPAASLATFVGEAARAFS